MNCNYIVCKRVYFYSQLDETMFFTWIQSIPCIEKIEGSGEELYLYLFKRELSYDDMKDLIALLYRYKIKMEQLSVFVAEENKFAVEPWSKQIYKSKK